MFHSQGHKKSFWLQIDIVKICTWHIRTLLWQTHLKQKNCLRLVSRTGYVEELGNQIWQSQCGASGARPGHCWQVSQHWPGIMLECGRETICLQPSPACHCRSSACMTQQPGSETATYSSFDWIPRSRQSTAAGIDLVKFQFYMIPWLTKQNDCTENYLCFHMKIRLEPQNNSSSPIPQIKHGCNRYIHHQQVTSAQG